MVTTPKSDHGWEIDTSVREIVLGLGVLNVGSVVCRSLHQYQVPLKYVQWRSRMHFVDNGMKIRTLIHFVNELFLALQ